MGPAVIAEKEQRVAHQLDRPLAMGRKPQAAGKQGRRHRLRPEVIDDRAVVAGNNAGRLAEVEGEGDRLVTGRDVDAADDAGERAGHRRTGWRRRRLRYGVGSGCRSLGALGRKAGKLGRIEAVSKRLRQGRTGSDGGRKARRRHGDHAATRQSG